MPPPTTYLWILPIPDDLQTPPMQLSEMLSSKERERVGSMGSAERRLEYTISHALLRTQTAKMLGVKPSDLPLTFAEGGKPFISKSPTADPSAHPPFVSLSHAKGFATCALSPHPIGIDIERIRETTEQVGVAKKYYSEKAFQRFDQEKDFERWKKFLQYWTIGEASYKASSLSLKEIFQLAKKTEIPIDDPREFKPLIFQRDSEETPRHWQFCQIYPSSEHILTLVIATDEPIQLVQEDVSLADLF